MTCIYKLAQKNVSNGTSSYKISREQAKRTIFHASEQNDRANDSANDRALIELGGSTTTNFKMTMKISKPESIPQFDKMTLN